MSAAGQADPFGAAAPAGERRRLRAFGLEIDAGFDAPGLPDAAGTPASGLPVRLDLATPEELDGGWPAHGVKRVLGEHFDDGPPARTIDAHPDAGYRLYARHFGLARISPSGDEVVCAPPDEEPWSWQRFLVGRILPWAAVLRGHEVLHASAIVLRDRVVAFVGETGTGKTSLAVHLVARGLGFFTDDVLALELRDGALRAHPGAAIASVRDAERDSIPQASWARLGTVLGHSGKTYVEVPRADAPLPLGALCFLDRGEMSGIAPIERLDPRLLLASTFVLGVQTPARLLNQLDVCSAIARDVPVFRLHSAPGSSAAESAGMAYEHLEAAWRE
jgi:hypothetical protein